MSIIIGILEEGLIYAILALGVYITYKILDFPDLSVDGTFPLGAAVTAMLILKDVPPLLTLLLAFLVGALAGCITGCKTAGARSRIWDYHDDGIIFGESANCGKGKFADFQQENDF